MAQDEYVTQKSLAARRDGVVVLRDGITASLCWPSTESKSSLRESHAPFVQSFNALPSVTEEESRLYAVWAKKQKRGLTEFVFFYPS